MWANIDVVWANILPTLFLLVLVHWNMTSLRSGLSDLMNALILPSHARVPMQNNSVSPISEWFA